MHFIKTRNFCSSKYTVERMKGQAADWETIPSNYTPVKDFYPEHIKALKPLQKGSQVPNEKEDKNWDRCFSRTVDGKEEHENYTVSHQRDANENHKEVPRLTYYNI